jgi:hypothetical protein
MNIYTIASLLAFIICILLGFFILIKGRKITQNRLFSLATIITGIWCLFPFLSAIANNEQGALFYTRFIYIYATFVPSTWLHFMLALVDKAKIKLRFIISIYLVSLLWSLLSFHPLFIVGVVRFAPYFSVKPGPLYLFFFLFFGIVMYYILLNLFQSYKLVLGYKKNQLKYILAASIISITAGIMHFAAAYFHTEPFPHDFLIVIFPCIIAYAIVRYRLMDITVAITRTGIFVLVYTLVLGLPFAVAGWFKSWLIGTLGANWWVAPLGLMAGLATVGPFIYIYLERKAEERLLREQRRYQDTLKQASVGMTRIRNLRKLLNLIAHIVTKTVRIAYAGIYLYNEQTDEYILQVSRDKGRMPVIKLTSDNPLITWLVLNRQPLVYEEVKRQMQDYSNPTYKDLEENMRLLTASVVIPSFLEDKFMGFIVLGDKISGKIYTPEDLNVFQVLASQAALAIENAQFVEEAKRCRSRLPKQRKWRPSAQCPTASHIR